MFYVDTTRTNVFPREAKPAFVKAVLQVADKMKHQLAAGIADGKSDEQIVENLNEELDDAHALRDMSTRERVSIFAKVNFRALFRKGPRIQLKTFV